MENPELAARASEVYRKSHSILTDAGASIGEMKRALHRVAEMIRDELGDTTAANALGGVDVLLEWQVRELHQKWLNDTGRAAELFGGLAKDLTRLRKRWWQFWK